MAQGRGLGALQPALLWAACAASRLRPRVHCMALRPVFLIPGRLIPALLICGLLMCGVALPGQAQPLGGPLNEGVVRSPLLVIDFDRVFAESQIGQQFNAALEREGTALVAENRRIEAELTEEELRLTEQRPGMAPEEFRALADAFDEKVQRLRGEQDAKATALGSRNEEQQRRFLQVAQPVLEGLMRETNAAVILERRSVFVAADAVDVTDLAIARINARLSRPDDLSLPAETPQGAPESTPEEGAVSPQTVSPNATLPETDPPAVTLPLGTPAAPAD